MSHEGATVWTFEIFYRRLLIATAGSVVVGYFVAVTALYFWLAQQPRNQVGWGDLAAPWRWSALRPKRGDTAVLTALDELKEQAYSNAFYNLRVGLARSPGNVEGRLTLVQMIIAYDPAEAVRIMEEGIPACLPDDRFVNGLLDVYAGQQIQAPALKVIEGVLQAHAGSLTPAGRKALERGRFMLWLQLERYAEVEAALPALRALDPAFAHGLECEWRIKTQAWPQAREIFETHFAERLQEPDVARLAISLAIGTGETELVQRAIRRLKMQAPDSTAPHLLAIQTWHRMKRPSLQEGAEQEFFQLFANNEAALQALSALGVAMDAPDLVTRASRMAAAGGFSGFAFQVHLTELALKRRQVEAAMQWLPKWEPGIGTLKNSQRFYPEFVRRLTRTTFSGAADQQAALGAHLAANPGLARLPVYLYGVSVLESAGLLAGAEEIGRMAETRFPQSDVLLAQNARLRERLAAHSQPQPGAAGAAAPGVVLPTTAAEARAQIDGLLAQESWVAARDWLRAVRTLAPAWLATLEPVIALREVELAYLTLDPLASRSSARSYLGRYRGEAETLELVALAGRLAVRGRLAEARLLQDEILTERADSLRVRQEVRALNLPDGLADVVATAADALAALDRLVANQDWLAAERLLKHLRDKPPAWAAEAAVDLKAREVNIRLGLDQRPLALAALKDLVNKGGVSRGVAFKLVRDLLAREDVEQARLLAQEISRLLPDDAAAARLLKETTVPPVAK